MKKIWAIFTYVQYWHKSRTVYKAHSPFVYDFINNVLKGKRRHHDYKSLHKYRKKLLSNKTKIVTTDFGSGAGKKEYVEYTESIGKLARRRSHSKKHLELLYRLTAYFKPKQILEIGTAVGLSSLFMQKGCRDSKVTTMEGCAVLSQVAQRGFKLFNADDIDIVIGNFNNTLSSTVEKMETLDLVFFDGNHSEVPTLNYFNYCMDKVNENSVFVFDDIHWSPGMSRAWKKIKNDSRVSFTIDIYWIGLVFFKKGFAKQHFVVR